MMPNTTQTDATRPFSTPSPEHCCFATPATAVIRLKYDTISKSTLSGPIISNTLRRIGLCGKAASSHPRSASSRLLGHGYSRPPTYPGTWDVWELGGAAGQQQCQWQNSSALPERRSYKYNVARFACDLVTVCRLFSMESKMKRRVSPRVDSMEPNPDISDDSALLQKAKTRVLLLFDELPEWARDNEYILSGWRPETNSYWESLMSMGYIHNESGNIYTHFFAALWMVVLGSWWSGYATERYPATNSDDAIVFFLFFLGGTVCYLLSTAYHVFSNHSHSTHLFCLKLDYLGILTVTAGCFPPGLWYTFPCASRQVKFTWIAVDLTAQFCAAPLALFSKSFQAPKMRPLRGFVFSVMASSAFYPIIVKIFQVGWLRANAEYGASLYGLTILIYLCSVTTYALRVTEAWKPGRFDIWGHSHQIFHVGMAIGLTVHFLAFFRAVNQFYAVKHGQCPE